MKEASQVRPFVKRWRNLWLLRPGPAVFTTSKGSWLDRVNEPLSRDEKVLLTGRYNAKKLLALVNQQPAEEPLHFDPRVLEWRLAGHLCIPRPLLYAFSLAQKYGVGSDLGLVRLYLDSYPKFKDRLRGEGPYFPDPVDDEQDVLDRVEEATTRDEEP